jgi:hypothetical protein
MAVTNPTLNAPLTNPSGLPASGSIYHVAWSKDSKFLYYGSAVTPFLNGYTLDPVAKTLTPIASLINGFTVNGVGRQFKIAKTGDIAVLTGDSTVKVNFLSLDQTTGKLTQDYNQSAVIQSGGWGLGPNKDGTKWAITADAAPFLRFYSVNKTTKVVSAVTVTLASGTTLPGQLTNEISLSDDASFVAIACQGANGAGNVTVVYALTWTDDTHVTVTRVANPTNTGVGNAIGSAIHPSQKYIAFNANNSAVGGVFVNKFTGGVLQNMAALPNGNLDASGSGFITWSDDGLFLIAGRTTGTNLFRVWQFDPFTETFTYVGGLSINSATPAYEGRFSPDMKWIAAVGTMANGFHWYQTDIKPTWVVANSPTYGPYKADISGKATDGGVLGTTFGPYAAGLSAISYVKIKGENPPLKMQGFIILEPMDEIAFESEFDPYAVLMTTTYGTYKAAINAAPTIPTTIETSYGPYRTRILSDDKGDIAASYGPYAALIISHGETDGSISSTYQKYVAAIRGTPTFGGMLDATYGHYSADIEGEAQLGGKLQTTFGGYVAEIVAESDSPAYLATTYGPYHAALLGGEYDVTIHTTFGPYTADLEGPPPNSIFTDYGPYSVDISAVADRAIYVETTYGPYKADVFGAPGSQGQLDASYGPYMTDIEVMTGRFADINYSYQHYRTAITAQQEHTSIVTFVLIQP